MNPLDPRSLQLEKARSRQRPRRQLRMIFKKLKVAELVLGSIDADLYKYEKYQILSNTCFHFFQVSTIFSAAQISNFAKFCMNFPDCSSFFLKFAELVDFPRKFDGISQELRDIPDNCPKSRYPPKLSTKKENWEIYPKITIKLIILQFFIIIERATGSAAGSSYELPPQRVPG